MVCSNRGGHGQMLSRLDHHTTGAIYKYILTPTPLDQSPLSIDHAFYDDGIAI
ncbi:hypothetical protein DAI22_07g156300 [Oryza sativa Japonica Group]|nr:hypothetical protein DAI22_07g156300 [Oryza sativa Japonica Group]